VHVLALVVKYAVADAQFVTQRKLVKVASIRSIHFLTRFTSKLVSLRSTEALFVRLAAVRICVVVLLSCSPSVRAPQLSYNPTHGSLTGSGPVTMETNSVHRYD
jgi:hypothetical protein